MSIAQSAVDSVAQTATSITSFINQNGAAQTNHAQNVATANGALEEVTGYLENVNGANEPTVTPDFGDCVDTAGTATDVDGDDCNGYAANPTWCGTTYDDDDFTSMEMCCACKVNGTS